MLGWLLAFPQFQAMWPERCIAARMGERLSRSSRQASGQCRSDNCPGIDSQAFASKISPCQEEATPGGVDRQGKWPNPHNYGDSELSKGGLRGYLSREISIMISVTICPPLRLIIPLLLFVSLMSAPAKEAFFVVEANSGRILMAQSALDKKPVASLTKIATATVALDWATATKRDLGTVIAVPASAATLGGSNPMGLRPGDRITLRNALYSALLGSDNAAAQTLAHYVGGGILHARGKTGDNVKEFVREMNELAKGLGMRRTRFENAHGMDSARERGYSTAADMARLSIYAMRKPGFVFFVKQKSRKVSFEQLGQTRGFTVQNTNRLLGLQNINGIKTGMTTLAGQCLATSSELKPVVEKLPDGGTRLTPRRLICVVLGSPDRFARTQTLVQQGWAFYDQWVKGGALVSDPAKETLRVPNPR